MKWLSSHQKKCSEGQSTPLLFPQVPGTAGLWCPELVRAAGGHQMGPAHPRTSFLRRQRVLDIWLRVKYLQRQTWTISGKTVLAAVFPRVLNAYLNVLLQFPWYITNTANTKKIKYKWTQQVCSALRHNPTLCVAKTKQPSSTTLSTRVCCSCIFVFY